MPLTSSKSIPSSVGPMLNCEKNSSTPQAYIVHPTRIFKSILGLLFFVAGLVGNVSTYQNVFTSVAKLQPKVIRRLGLKFLFFKFFFICLRNSKKSKFSFPLLHVLRLDFDGSIFESAGRFEGPRTGVSPIFALRKSSLLLGEKKSCR